jgi:hypothetical protein
MGSHDPFGYLKHKLWAKEGLGVKLSIWFPITKSQNSPWFPYVQVACHIPLKRSRLRLKLHFKPHLNWRFTHKIMGLQNFGSPNFGNYWHLGVGLVSRHNEYYKEQGDGFYQVQAVVSFVSSCLPMACLCTKSILATH